MPASCASLTADAVTCGLNGSASQPVGLKSGEAWLVSVPFGYWTVSDECVETLQLLGMRVNGLPFSVPLTVSDIFVRTPPRTGPRPERSSFSTDATFPDAVWTRPTATWVVWFVGGPVRRSMPAASEALGGGTR